MQKIIVIGIGAGNPEHMTVQAISALNRLDLILIPRKQGHKDDLAELRREICRRFLTNPAARHLEFDLPVRHQNNAYLQTVDDWHDAIAQTYKAILARELAPCGNVGLLVWGDPSLYDSTLRIIARLQAMAGAAFELEVIPGVTSVQSLAASHRIPLNTIGGPVLLTTGRRLRQSVQDMDLPENAETIVVMLDGACAFTCLAADQYDIWWGAYLGMANEITIAGPLVDVSARIIAVRAEARARHGWIMDVYLLRRRS